MFEYKSGEKTVQEIIHLYKNKQLNLNPGFQRSSVWNDRDRSKLIDSILQRYPLPSIFLYKREQDGDVIYDVIDGKQRIETVLMFTGAMRGNRFTAKSYLPSDDQVRSIDWSTIKRKKFQYLINDYNLQTIEISGSVGDIIDLFLRINSTGKSLTGAEKRHARYYKSEFLKRANQLAVKYESLFKENKILSAGQITRKKHVELVSELMVAAHHEGAANKKTALDNIMRSDSIRGRELERASKATATAINRLKQMFPKIGQTRFRQLSDYYSLVVLMQKFEREALILTDKRSTRLAWELLVMFSVGVDEVRRRQKKAEGTEPGQEIFRDYLLTVSEGTDDIRQRRRREEILCGLLEPLFQRKDSARLFSPEQRRILWNTAESRRCVQCKSLLTWDDFTIDHIDPWSMGGRTKLNNAAIMCRQHNSQKGNRISQRIV